MLYPCRHTCRPASTQSRAVVWKNFVPRSVRNKFFFLSPFGGFRCSSLITKHLRSFWYETRTFTGCCGGQCSIYHELTSGMSMQRRV
jgi:hypothetical protein